MSRPASKKFLAALAASRAPRRSIVVTIPKAKIDEVEAEEAEVARREAAGETGISYYWAMARLPKEVPPRIYFVWNGAVRAWHEVLGQVGAFEFFEHPDFKDETWKFGDPAPTRAYPVVSMPAIFMRTKINMLEKPIPMAGFQGFRYIEVEVP